MSLITKPGWFQTSRRLEASYSLAGWRNETLKTLRTEGASASSAGVCITAGSLSSGLPFVPALLSTPLSYYLRHLGPSSSGLHPSLGFRALCRRPRVLHRPLIETAFRRSGLDPVWTPRALQLEIIDGTPPNGYELLYLQDT